MDRSTKIISISIISSSVLCVCMVLAGCDLPPSFGDEYRDSAKNYIESLGLNQTPDAADDGSTIALESPGIWDWAWRGQAGTGNSFPYMTLTDDGLIGTAVSSGTFTLEADVAAWKLELANLAGDPYFEGALPTGWMAADGNDPLVTIESSTIITAANTTSHQNFLTLSSKGNDWAGFDPNVAGFILDDPATFRNNVYLLNAFTQSSSMQYLIDDYTAVSNFESAMDARVSGSRVTLDTFTVPSVNTRVMFAKSSGDQDVDIDDIRIARTDIKEALRLRLLLAPADTVPSLVAGQYEFSIWIKAPAGYLLSDDVARRSALSSSDPFAAKAVTLSIRQVGFLVERITPILFQETFPVSSSWTRIALRMGDGNLDRFNEGSEGAVLELAITPFDPLDLAPGAVTIADPRLRFFIDGYTD